MTDTSDADLLERFTRENSAAAFTVLVERHIGLVHSVALRHTADPQQAQDITQAVFIILARKAAALNRQTVLPGWLYHTARLTAANVQRAESRRIHREQEAYMQSALHESTPDALWAELSPLLDEAMARLGARDRDALVLRYFQNKSLAEVGAALGLEERTAQKRVARALDKLRAKLVKRGVTLTAAVIAGAVAANSVQAAPVALVQTISAIAVAKGAAAGTATLALVKGASKMMAWAKYKTLIYTATLATITGGALVTVGLHERPRELPAVKTSVNAPATVLRETMTDGACICLETPPGVVVVRPDGKIIVGTSLFGRFVDPQSGLVGTMDRLAMQLNADGSLDHSFYCGAELKASDAGQAHLDLLPDGKFFATGMFNNAGGKPRFGYARFLADGSLDEMFVSWFTNALWMPAEKVAYNYLDSQFGGIRPAAVLSDGSVAVVENLGSSPLGVYRLDSTGRLVSPSPNALPDSVSINFPIQNDGFWLQHLGNPATGFFRTFFAKFPIELFRIAVRLPEGGAIVGTRERFVNGILTAPGGFMRLDKNWMPDLSFTNQYEADRRGSMTIKLLKGGKLLVAGGFTKMDGEDFPGLVQLNADGQIDHSFHCEITTEFPSRPVTDFSIQEDGRIVICGTFTAVNGFKRRYLARLNPDGSLDDTFKSPFIGMDEFQTHHRIPIYHLAAMTSASTTDSIVPNTIATTIPPETILINSMSYHVGVAMIQFTGNANKTYVLQSKDTMDATDWNTISTNQANASGAGFFRDEDAINHPSRFYRIATP